jgi:hypothetical protein
MKKRIGVILLSFLFLTSYAQDYQVGSKVQARWGGYWRKGTIVEIKKDKYKVHYDGYGVGYDQWLTKDDFRKEKPKATSSSETTPEVVVSNVSNPPVQQEKKPETTNPTSKLPDSKSGETVKNTGTTPASDSKNNKRNKRQRSESTPTETATQNTAEVEPPIKEKKTSGTKNNPSSSDSKTETAANNISTTTESSSKKSSKYKGEKGETPPPASTATIKVTTVEPTAGEKNVAKPSSSSSAPMIKPTMVGDKTYISGASSEPFVFYLAKDNIIIRNPRNGVNPVNVSAEKKNNPANVGNYTIEADKMKVKWSDGTTSEWRVAYSTVVIYGLNGAVVSPLKPMPPNYSLNSIYKAQGLKNSNENITFKADGNFIDPAGQKGRYSILGNTLTLAYENGQSARSVISLNTVAGKRYLAINNTSYALQ